MDFSTYDRQLQVPVSEATGEVVTLQDDKFPWLERRVKTVRLSRLYGLAGYPDYELKAGTCATWLKFGVMGDGSKRLHAANFCQLRLCPMCISRRARKAVVKLSKVMNLVASWYDCRFLFLTLTIKNVEGKELGAAISQLTTAWVKLIRHRQVERSVKGWYRTVEVTRKGKGYHPHIHAILAVSPSYFGRKSGEYISHDEWVRRWRLALKVDYDPSVRIQTAKAKGELAGGQAAALEAGKYVVKDSDYIDKRLKDEEAAEIVKDYTEALRRKRLTAYGGWLKEAAKELDAENLEEDDDLVHADEETVRGDVAELIETYNWHFGAGDYILMSREINPLKLCAQCGEVGGPE